MASLLYQPTKCSGASSLVESAGMAELADAADSKSAGLRPLGVRLPLPAPNLALCFEGAANASLVSCRSVKLPTVVKL